jgi:hypothetical protein
MLSDMKTTSKVRVTNSPKLTPQAQQIVDIVRQAGPLIQDVLLKQMCRGIRTKSKKPMTVEQASRLLSDYKTKLVEGGFITLQFAAPKKRS